MFRRLFTYLAVILIVWAMAGCATSSPDRGGMGREEVHTDSAGMGVDMEAASQLQRIINQYRTRLSDVYSTQKHDMPAAFLNDSARTANATRNPFDGYRIQILSTLSVTAADSASRRFRMWADSTITNYQPQTYVFFKQPYYKVHVGDFQGQERAIQFSRFIKQRFPEAWVVPDRINPTRVPADTVVFGFRH